MVASINASTSAGVVTTADTSGILALQTAGTTAVSISASQVVTLTNALPVTSGGTGVTTSTGTGAVVLGTSPTITTPTISSLSSASATALTLQSAGTTAVTIDTSQNVLVGTTTNSASTKVAILGSSTVNGISVRNGTIAGNYESSDATRTSYWQFGRDNISTGNYVFTYNGSQQACIDTSGNLLLGTTTRSNDEKFTVYQNAAAVGISVRSLGSALGNYETSDQNRVNYWTFGRDNAVTGNFVFGSNGTLRGSINFSTGTYTASSDLRLKKNITNITYGLNEVMAMRPVTYLMNEEADTAKKHLGFIAQELKALVDESVDDLIDPDTQFYMLDKGGLVPVLVKAIQELKAINDTQAETINALTARIVALEGA
jgi:hypothetical protein